MGNEMRYIGNKILANIMYILFGLIILILYYYFYFKMIASNEKEKKLIKEFKNFTEGPNKGFKFSHITPREAMQEYQAEEIDKSRNKSFILYGGSDSGKTTFLKFYLKNHNISDYLVFGRDASEWPPNYFMSIEKFKNVPIENLKGKTVILDDAGAYKDLKTKVEDFFRYGRHEEIQTIYLAHYAKDVVPTVRDNIKNIFLTLSNTNKFFENIRETYHIDKEIIKKWQSFAKQYMYGLINYSTITNEYKIYNSDFKLVFDSQTKTISTYLDPADYVSLPSYFFIEEDYTKMRLFLEEMSGQTIRITPQNIAFYYVVYCKQNNILVNEQRVSTYFSEESEEIKNLKKDMKEIGVKSLKQYWNVVVKGG